LDYNSRGLLVFTNDGDNASRLLHPSTGVTRTYRVKVKPGLSEEDRKNIEKGVEIEKGVMAGPARVRIRTEAVEISLKEGKNREIRKIMQVLGYQIRDLKRISLGKLRLGDLKEGKFRILSPQEIRLLIS
jgi:23S rRNA pseudouridine2605 synthase